MKSQLPTIKSSFSDIREVVKDPDLWAKVQSYIDEAVKVKQAITHQKENLKALRDACHADIKIHPKLFNCAVDAVYNNDYLQRLDGISQQQAMLELLMESIDPPAGEKFDEPKLRLA